MNVLRATLCLLSMVTLSGTSANPTSPCAHAAAAAVAFGAKAEGCTGERAVPFDAVSCEAATARCTADDRAAIEAFLTCVDAMPACSDEAGWRAQFDRCSGSARLSPGCSL